MPEHHNGDVELLPERINAISRATVLLLKGYLRVLAVGLFVPWHAWTTPIFNPRNKRYPSHSLCLILSLFLFGLIDTGDLPKGATFTDYFVHLTAELSPELSIGKAMWALFPCLVIAILGAWLACWTVDRAHRPQLRNAIFDALSSQLGSFALIILIFYSLGLFSEHRLVSFNHVAWSTLVTVVRGIAVYLLFAPLIGVVIVAVRLNGNSFDSWIMGILAALICCLTAIAMIDVGITLPTLHHAVTPSTQPSTTAA